MLEGERETGEEVCPLSWPQSPFSTDFIMFKYSVINRMPKSIFVFSFSLIKDFLRNIPKSVFSTDLFDEWLGIMDGVDEDEEKIRRVKRYLGHSSKNAHG